MLEEEQQQEDEKAAQLEALLEQFREPEEAPRKKNGAIWLMLALIASLGGCWLAMLAAKGSLQTAKTGLGATMKPGKVKDRNEFYAKLRVVDVEADYRERCKKGMRAQEVRWILEDFIQAGLSEEAGGLPAEVKDAAEVVSQTSGWKEWQDGEAADPPELSDKAAEVLKEKGLQLARSQQRWYADALADGLRLDREQKKEAYQSGLKLVEKLSADFPQAEDALELAHTGESPAQEAADPAEESSLLTPILWLQDERSEPSQKCELRADQSAVLSTEQGEQGAAEPIHEATGVFPFTADQAKEIPDGDVTGLVMSLHPAQLRMLLLTEPGMATTLGSAFEGKDE
ncbi:hypothetical protein OJ996_07145 [Luteolibacter sp. GHJ8]|uniref:Uncharacterized protein n=1 Tax=Luteolibacter rhizosphaerae TaxID=2989719 RepID=A0ABT3G0G9_9BACT|nr:hypothetical protein [Luteolibacter rhizosphaerae]MCW1913341.1 hypothetical protein [Luteolibacter rhizosphaerae]